MLHDAEKSVSSYVMVNKHSQLSKADKLKIEGKHTLVSYAMYFMSEQQIRSTD